MKKSIFALLTAVLLSNLAMADSNQHAYFRTEVRKVQGTIQGIFSEVKNFESDPKLGYPQATANILLDMQKNALASVFLACEGIGQIHGESGCAGDIKAAESDVNAQVRNGILNAQVGQAVIQVIHGAYAEAEGHGVER